MYQEHIMDHYRYPRNKGVISPADFSCDYDNPSCGDVISVTGTFDGRTIKAIAFEGKGCVISQAAASLLMEHVIGKSLDDIFSYDRKTIEQLVEIPLGPVRLKCALLSLEALHKALKPNHS